MKNYLIAFSLVFAVVAVEAQKNNPYFETGNQYVESLKIIHQDMRAGRPLEMNQSTLDRYVNQLPIKGTATVDMAAAIYNTIKAPGFNGLNYIDNSSMSPFTKTLVKDLIVKGQTMGLNDYKVFLALSVSKVQNEKLPVEESKMILSLISIADAVSDSSNGLQREGSGDCEIFGSGNSQEVPQWVCTIGFAAIGYWVGSQICGLPCGIGGAVIGGVLGAIS